jgi:hypothetical protein
VPANRAVIDRRPAVKPPASPVVPTPANGAVTTPAPTVKK